LNTAYGADNKTVKNVSISYSGSIGSDEVYILPFLGEPGRITSGISGNVISFNIPEIDKGMVVMIKRN
ncbi:MAG TPA: hypothetical protein VLB50_00360, partial [Ignavibacteriaceae bacterium]|nr:hypothetical protein [Ignavibacteriaceae bacterium]